MRIFRSLSLCVGRLGLSFLGVIVIISAITVILIYLFAVPVLQALTVVGSVSTAVGIFLAILTLRDTQEWNRRQYTVDFLKNWNECTREHFVELEKQFPDFLAVPDFIKKPDLVESWCIDKEKAKLIAEVKSESDRKLRVHLVELFNYFEMIASAYEQHVVDRDAVQDSAGTVILDFCVYFQPFINEMRKSNRRDPWPPLSRVIDLWLNEEFSQSRQKQADEASRRYVETLKKLESKLKKPTGI
jgi:hypothetical protein